MKIARLTLNLVSATQFWSNNIEKPFIQVNIQLYSSSRFFKSEAPASIFHRFLKYNTQFNLTLSSSLPTCLHVPSLTRFPVLQSTLTGHVGDVYKCKFFPSGEVVVSGGADMQLKIWCALTGKCPVTLSGHRMAVTDFDFIDKGKNIISVSKFVSS